MKGWVLFLFYFFFMKLNLVSEAEISQLRDIVAGAERVLVLGHTNPDGDAIGSTLTWAEYMRQQGKEATVVVPDMFPDFLHWLPGSETIVRYDKRPEQVEKLFAECDTIFCLDFNVPSRITEALGEILVKAPGKKVLIDHHLDPDVPTVQTISRPEMSSTSEMVFRLIYQLGGYEKMTHKMAVTAYCGMMTDTGGFTFNSSRPEIFYIISLLLEKGIDKDKIPMQMGTGMNLQYLFSRAPILASSANSSLSASRKRVMVVPRSVRSISFIV